MLRSSCDRRCDVAAVQSSIGAVGLSDPMLMSEDAELLFASLPIFCSSFSLSFR